MTEEGVRLVLGAGADHIESRGSRAHRVRAHLLRQVTATPSRAGELESGEVARRIALAVLGCMPRAYVSDAHLAARLGVDIEQLAEAWRLLEAADVMHRVDQRSVCLGVAGATAVGEVIA